MYNSEAEITYSKPDFYIPEFKKDDDWYKQVIRYYTTFYNTNFNTFSEDNPEENLPPVEKGLRYALYLLGKQKNIDYNHLTQDPTGNTLQSIWIKGKKVKTLVDHLKGNLINYLANKELTARSLSKEASSKRTQMFDDLMLKYDEQGLVIFQQLGELGIDFSPAGRRAFQSKEDIEKFIERDWKENGEIFAFDMATAIEQFNDADIMYLNAFEEFCCSNYCGIENFVENGQVKQEMVHFYNLIYDFHNCRPYNKKGRFVGKIERLTPEEIIDRCPGMSADDIADLREIAKDRALQNDVFLTYNGGNVNWWEHRSGELLVTMVKMYWIAPRDPKYKESEDKFGNKHYKKESSKNKSGDYMIKDLYVGTLIGNKYLYKNGLAKNVVRSYKNKAEPELPIKVFSGANILTDGVPIVGLIAQNQDRLDMIRFKITEMIGRDAGKVYIINGNKITPGYNSRELAQDFKSMGLHVSQGVSGEEDDPTNNQSLVEKVDMTLDPNIQRYIELYREEERIMEEAMNIPKIALGQQQTYTGLGTQRGTIQQSSIGLANMYHQFIRFNEYALQHALNLAKNLYVKNGNFEGEMVLGERGIKYLKITENYNWEDLLIFIRTRDVIDENMRQRLLAYAQAWSQNPEWGISPVQILEMERATNLTSLINNFEYALKKAKAASMAQSQQQQQQAMQLQQNQNQAKTDLEGMRQEGENQRTEMKVQADMLDTMAKSDVAENQTKGLPIKK